MRLDGIELKNKKNPKNKAHRQVRKRMDGESEKTRDKVRCVFDIITVSGACVYRSAHVYCGTHTERTPGELSTHTHTHAHRQP